MGKVKPQVPMRFGFAKELGEAVRRIEMWGFALMLAWQMRAFESIVPFCAGLEVSPLFVTYAAAACLGALCFVGRKLDSPMFSHPWTLSFALVAGVVGSLASVLVACSALEMWALYVAAGLVGLSSSILLCAWAVGFASMTANEVFAAVAVAYGAASAMGLALVLVPMLWSVVLMALCGLGTCACLVAVSIGGVSGGGGFGCAPATARPHGLGRTLRVVTGLAIYAVALGVTAGTRAADVPASGAIALDGGVPLLGLGLSALVAGCWAFSRGRLGLAFFVRLSTPCLVVMFLVNAVVPAFTVYAPIVSGCVWALVVLFAFLLTLELARREEVGLASLFPAAFSLLFLGFAVGEASGQVLFLHCGSASQTVLYVDIVLVVIVVTSASFLMTNWGPDLDRSVGTGRRAFSDTAPAAPAASVSAPASALAPAPAPAPVPAPASAAPSAPFPASAPARLGDADAPAEQTAAPLASRASEQDRRPKDSVRSRCERLARIHGLSDREFDVLELLAKGHTRVSVAKRLYVSENTVRVHVKNIYAKLGIHSKQQLIDLVDRQ